MTSLDLDCLIAAFISVVTGDRNTPPLPENLEHPAEAWVRRASCRDDWKAPEVFGRWLRGVALNQYCNWARGRRRRARTMTVEPAFLETIAVTPEPESSELLESLRRAISRFWRDSSMSRADGADPARIR